MLFDWVGGGERNLRDGEAKRLRVLRLINSSKLVGACTASLPGFAPLRMRSMYPVAGRKSSNINAIDDQTASVRKDPLIIHRWQAVLGR